MPRRRITIPSKSSRERLARVVSRCDLASSEEQTTVYLLLQLRKANRKIIRLRACALAALDVNEELRAALAALRPRDFEP